MKSSIVIFGSSISRDILNYDKNKEFNLVKYFARSSFASIYSKKITQNNFLSNLTSEFQRRTVKYDLEKTFVKEIGDLEFDLLLIDLIDERFDLLLLDNESICTISNELKNSGALKELKGRVVNSGSEEHYNLWEKGWSQFVEHMKFLGLLEHLRVHKAYWCINDINGNTYDDIGYTTEKIVSVNEYLDKLYKRMEQDLKKNQFIEIDKVRIGACNHKWGRSPFHYVNQYYTEIIKKIIQSYTKKNHSKINKQRHYDPYILEKPVFNFDSLDSFVKKNKYIDGIYRVHITDNFYLDICLQNTSLLFSSKRDTKFLLAGFSGAVTNRVQKKAPFFSGIGISQKLTLPIISISDPTLALDSNINLGWYAGNEKIPNLQFIIKQILDTFAKKFGAKLLLFGGSGGGFAALVQATLLESDSIIFVWNPQTSIQNYVQHFVEKYDSIAFKSKKQNKKYAFNDYVISNVKVSNIKSNVHIFFMQNQDDWHLKKHTAPFIEDIKLRKYSKTTFISEDGKKAFYFGLWGKGHLPPPKKQIEKILENLIKTENVVLCAWNLEEENKNVPSFLRVTKESSVFPLELKINYKTTEKTILIEGKLPENCQLEVAYYLLINNKKIATRWYKTTPNCKFENIETTTKEALEVVAFIKDIFGTIISKKFKI